MGSVIDYIDCPKCGNEAMCDFYYKTGEEYTNCNHCGYSRSFSIKNLADRDNQNSEFEWVPEYELKEYTPRGAYRIRMKGSIAYECGGFIDDSGPKAFADQVEAQKENIEHAEYTIYNADTNEITRYVLIQEPDTLQNELERDGLI